MDLMQVDILEEEIFDHFIFSRPGTIFDPPRVVNFGMGSDHVFDAYSNKRNVFTFSSPTIVSQYDEAHASLQANNRNRYKPKISRGAYKPTLNVFANALKDTGAFEQLKKNSRSRTTKINIENSITCSGVPKDLLTKSAAKEYFTKYGNIVKITIRPRKHVIVVTYTTKNEANIAYYGGSDYMGEKFYIEWTKSESSLKLPTKKKELHKNIVENLLKASEDEVKSELEAMTNLEYNLPSNKGIDVSTTNMLLPTKVRVPGGKATTALPQEKLMPKLEKPATKVEKLETESLIAKPLSNTSLEELQNIIYQVAITAEDKYKVLEARDRLMRLKRVKPASLAVAKVTSGTCPDMCPEKERLMRESQRQVAPYEQLEGNEYRINHATAIKQYSRSSADQEEPMPHELRPVRSLKMTMSYLLHEIVDLCEQEGTNLAEWYHYLWDRTRGIRKDITQQELCCVNSVELIEQCARFHIVCSERLCAEDASVFDKKINTENLTKCLQTLKYMYHDLRVKGVTCENESEFRAYIVLLNLNNGNFLYDLQQLPRSVQNSSEVQFAIKVYFALDSNNYCKFFKLVRDTTYLNACILLRYFSQVRVKALSVMLKAYCRRISTAFPLYELMDILGFEDENEASHFCEQVGLNLSNDELHVLLNRENFTMPSTSIQQGRARNLIESKRIALNFSIGQCIAGGRMPERTYKGHKPHNSFDAHGSLLPESMNAADQNPDISTSSSSTADPVRSSRGFAEKEAKRMPKLTSIRDKSQMPAQIRKQPQPSPPMNNTTNEHTSVQRSATIVESVGPSVLKTGASTESDAGEHGQMIQPSVFENAKSAAVQSRSAIADKQHQHQQAADSEIAGTAKTRSREDAGPPDSRITEQPAIFGGNNPNDPRVAFSQSQSSAIAAAEASRNAEPAGPFVMAMNKSIFSGAGGSATNMFAKSAASSSSASRGIFGNDQRFTTPSSATSAQRSANDDDDASVIANQAERGEILHILHPKEEQPKDPARTAGESPWTAMSSAEVERARQEKMERTRRTRRNEERSKEIYDELRAEVTREICMAIAREEIDRLQAYGALSERVIAETIDVVAREMCDAILTAAINSERRLRAIAMRSKNRAVAKCFGAWRRHALKRRQQREALEDTPVWLQRRSVEECARMLYTKEQDVAIRNMRKRRTYESPEMEEDEDDDDDDEEDDDDHRYHFGNGRGSAEGLAPIELIVHSGIKENSRLSAASPPTSNVFWKLVISWPDLSNRPMLWYHKKMINGYLYPDDYTMEPIVKIYQPNEHETVHVCIRHFEGFISERHLIGADALLFVVDATEEYRSVARRLTRNVLSRQRLMPVPLALLVLGDGDLESQDVVSDLETFLESGYVSEYTIMYERHLTPRVTLNLTQSAILWLAVSRSPANPLEMDRLRNVCDVCLSEELWLRILDDSAYNKWLSSALKDPNFMIDLHNEAVNHLMDVILDLESTLYTSFAPEFKRFLRTGHRAMPYGYEYFDESWKRDEYRAKLESAMNDFLLPPWSAPWPVTDPQELRRHVMNYCAEVLPADSNYDIVFGDIFSNFFLLISSTLPESADASFVHVLLLVIKEKVRLLDEDRTIVYNRNHIKHFRTLPWYFKSNVLTEFVSRESNPNNNDASDLFLEPSRKRKRLDRSKEIDLDVSSLDDEFGPLAEFCENTKDQVLRIHFSSKEVENRLQTQRSQNMLLEERLKNALFDEVY